MDEADLRALGESIGAVLGDVAGSRQLHDHIDGKIALDRQLWMQARELGWLGIGLPESAGGLGLGVAGLDVLYRQLGRRAAPGPFIASLSAAQTLCQLDDPVLHSDWLPKLVSGECSLAVAVQPIGPVDGELWLLGAPDAAAALVPVSDGEWALISLEGTETVAVWDGTRSVMSLDSAGARVLARLPGDPTRLALARNLSLAVASDSIGGARAIAEQTLAYMKERQQFGKVIASFQALKHRVADLFTKIAAAEEVVALAVESAQAGASDAQVWAMLAKVRASEVFSLVAADCLQLHGGVGFTWEFDVHLFLNRARLNEFLVAPNHVLRDHAADGLGQAVREGRQPLELAL